MRALRSVKLSKGVVLLLALSVMSLAAILSVTMTEDQYIIKRRTQNILLQEQLFMYLLSAEDFTKIALAEDDPKQDSYRDDWHTEVPVSFPMEQGAISGLVSDMQSKLNLNNLAKPTRNKWDEERLRTAVSSNGIPIDIASAIMDWLDQDQETLPGGAEDVDYLGGERPYRTGGGMMGSVSELKLIKGMNREYYEKLIQFVTVIPNEDNSPININTASAAVLRMIVPELSEAEAESLAEDLKEHPLNEPGDLIDHAIVKGKKVDTNGLSTETNYFLLQSVATFTRSKAKMHSIIYRQDKQNIKVVMRSLGGL